MTPSLLLKAAKLAYPEIAWIISARPSKAGKIIGQPLDWDGDQDDYWLEFDIKHDWPALQVALEKLGWEFSYQFVMGNGKDEFCAVGGVNELHSNTEAVALHAQTKPQLLLACVERTEAV